MIGRQSALVRRLVPPREVLSGGASYRDVLWCDVSSRIPHTKCAGVITMRPRVAAHREAPLRNVSPRIVWSRTLHTPCTGVTPSRLAASRKPVPRIARSGFVRSRTLHTACAGVTTAVTRRYAGRCSAARCVAMWCTVPDSVRQWRTGVTTISPHGVVYAMVLRTTLLLEAVLCSVACRVVPDPAHGMCECHLPRSAAGCGNAFRGVASSGHVSSRTPDICVGGHPFDTESHQ